MAEHRHPECDHGYLSRGECGGAGAMVVDDRHRAVGNGGGGWLDQGPTGPVRSNR